MKKTMSVLAGLAALALVSSPVFASDMPDGAKLFKKKCKMCHSMNKKKVGPAVATMNADAAVLAEIIMNGKKRMPKFGHKFSAEEIDALVAFLLTKQEK